MTTNNDQSTRAAHWIPAGYALVPLEPTPEMLAHAEKTLPGAFSIGGEYRAMLTAAPAAAPPKLEDIEQYRLQMAGISTAALGYWKEGDGIHPDYDTLALRDVAKLYAKYDRLYKALQASTHGLHPADANGPCLCGQCEFVRLRDAALTPFQAPATGDQQ